MQYFCDLENREAKETAPGVHIRTFWGNKMLLSIVDLAANAVVPAHSHPHEQAGTVISGEFEMTISGETRWLKPGDTYIVPGGLEHGGRTGEDPARVMDMFSPVREDYQYLYGTFKKRTLLLQQQNCTQSDPLGAGSQFPNLWACPMACEVYFAGVRLKS